MDNKAILAKVGHTVIPASFVQSPLYAACTDVTAALKHRPSQCGTAHIDPSPFMRNLPQRTACRKATPDDNGRVPQCAVSPGASLTSSTNRPLGR
eukprot:4893148-Pleurochrysis_carterae.AAC.1